VRALVAHVCPEKALFDQLSDAIVDAPPQMDDAVDMLRFFNESGGPAHTMAEELARTATEAATALTAEDAVARFVECADATLALTMPGHTVIRHPVVGTATLAAVAEVAVMEATTHLLDLADAVGGVEPSAAALAATRDLLIALPEPITAIETLTGRRAPGTTFPVLH